MTLINPHRLRLPSTLETTLPVEVGHPPVSHEHVLVEALIMRHEHLHQTGADTAPLMMHARFEVPHPGKYGSGQFLPRSSQETVSRRGGGPVKLQAFHE